MVKREILISITGRHEKDWKSKLKDIEKLKIKRIALFLEIFSKAQRKKIYEALLDSHIKEIPLVHIRNDMDKWELEFLVKNFKSKYLTIHESSFNNLKEWKGLHKKLFLEMNYDNKVFKNSKVEKIGGFCIDLSHFKASLARWTHDFEYVTKKENIHKYFKCNHINGYSKSWKKDLHTVRSLKEFDYLKTLPKFIFGKVIAIETFNGISDQLKFKKYLTKILRKI